MKKFWKLMISIILILIIGGAGTAFYLLKVKTYDIADEEVDEIAGSEYEIMLPDESPNSDEETSDSKAQDQNEDEDVNNNKEAVDDASNPSADSDAAGTPTEQASQESSNQLASDSKNEDDRKAKEVTVASIKQKYNPSFQNLESQANSKLNALVGQAYAEYQNKKNNGESISFGYFYQKYSSAASALESNTDAAFQSVLNAVENDLVKNGFSKSEANSFKKEYEAQKKARENALLNKVKEAL
jgi:hypothetical protein